MTIFSPISHATTAGSPGYAGGMSMTNSTPSTPSSVFALPPTVAESSAHDELQELVRTLRIFISCVEQYPSDPVAKAVASKARAPLAQATELCVRGVLDEFRLAAATTGDTKVLLSAIWFLREFCEASAAAKGLIRQFDGTSLLVAVLMNSQIDDYLMQECVRMLDCLQGSEGILEAIRHAQQKSASVLAQLIWHLRDRAKRNNEQLQQMPPAKLLRAALSSLEAYPNDAALHGAVFTLVAELMLEEEFRSAFVEVGGWPYVLTVLEIHKDNNMVQRRGLQILCELHQGWVSAGEHTARVAQAVMDCVRACHYDHQCVEWGLWLLIELGAMPTLLPVLAEAGETSAVGLGVLQALLGIHWGETELVDISIIPDVVKVVGTCTLRSMPNACSEAMELGVQVLVCVAREVAMLPQTRMHPSFASALSDAVQVVLEVLRQRMFDVDMVDHCLELVRVFQDSPAGSQIRNQVRDGLFGGPPPALLNRLSDFHASQQAIQYKVMWAQGAISGPSAVIDVMERLAGSLPSDVCGTKTLGWLFDEFEELDAMTLEARALAVRALVRVMCSWPREHGVLARACQALSAISTHGLDSEGGPFTIETMKHGLDHAWRIAAPLAAELDREDSRNSRDKARWLRAEIIRLETECVKVVPPPWRQELQAEVLRAGVAHTQCECVARDTSAGEVRWTDSVDSIRSALLALGVCGQAEATVRVLQQGGEHGLSLLQAAAEAVVDLCRLGMKEHLCRTGLLEATRAAKQDLQGRYGTDGGHMQVVCAVQFAEDWVAQ